jgi:hypothetical protein
LRIALHEVLKEERRTTLVTEEAEERGSNTDATYSGNNTASQEVLPDIVCTREDLSTHCSLR